MVINTYYTEEQEKKILEMYKETSGNAAEAVRILKSEYEIEVSNNTICRRWKDVGYEILGRGTGQRTDKIYYADEAEKERIVAAYNRYGGVPSIAAKSINKSPTHIADIWKDAGLEIIDVRTGQPLKTIDRKVR
ncbi:MAG TPA: hypothetical protein VJI68_02215 [Candidatus Nanoarchaeia archaeon]|nr:hypothetical protein [Candidatus Nanoarchaeia archaeon]